VYVSVTFTDSINVGDTFSYTATATNGGTSFSSTGTTSPLNITGLTEGVTYTFSVTATNSGGIRSNVSNTTTLEYINTPSAPLNPFAEIIVENNAFSRISYTWSAPNSNGGRPITSYLIGIPTGTLFVTDYFISYTTNLTFYTQKTRTFNVYASNDNINYGSYGNYTDPISICTIS
jgi:hypothetical protein